MSSKIKPIENDAKVYEIKNTIYVESDRHYFVIKKGNLFLSIFLI